MHRHACTLSLSLSLSHTHTRTHARTHARTHRNDKTHTEDDVLSFVNTPIIEGVRRSVAEGLIAPPPTNQYLIPSEPSPVCGVVSGGLGTARKRVTLECIMNGTREKWTFHVGEKEK